MIEGKRFAKVRKGQLNTSKGYQMYLQNRLAFAPVAPVPPISSGEFFIFLRFLFCAVCWGSGWQWSTNSSTQQWTSSISTWSHFLPSIMQECASGTLVSRTGCILSYGGSTRDIAINYAVLGIDVLMSCLVFLVWRDQREKRLPALGSFLFVVLFQLTICWVIACSGISVIWCAICGWMLHEQRQLTSVESQQGFRKFAASTLHVLIIPLNIGIIVYYAIVAPMITTVAHFCAMVLGVLLSKSSMPKSDHPQDNDEVGGVTAVSNSTPLVDTNLNKERHGDVYW